MKWLKWALVLVVAIGIIAVLAVFLTPPTTYRTRVQVDRSTDVAWKVFADETRMGEWLPGFKSIKTISGDPQTVGSKYSLVFEEDGKELVFEEEVLSYVEGREFRFKMTNPMMNSEIAVLFDEENGGTMITTENTVSGRGLLRPIIPFMKSSMIERQTNGYERLKALIEAEPEELPLSPPEESEAAGDPTAEG